MVAEGSASGSDDGRDGPKRVPREDSVPIHSGGDPRGLARCRECGRVYPFQRTEDDRLRPIGTPGGCTCGNTEFERFPPSEPVARADQRPDPSDSTDP